MKLKKEYIVLAVVIVALGLYLGLKKSDGTHYQLPALAAVDSKAIDRIEVKSEANTFELARKDDAWTVGPKAYPVDGSKVKDMVETLEKLTLTALVSESSNYVRYDLSDDKKITVKAWAGNQQKRLFDIGKAADTYQHTFVKLDKNKAVYHARGNFRKNFDLAIDELRDKNVLKFDKTKITEAVIESEGKSWTITKNEVESTAGDESGTAEGSQNGEKDKKQVWKTADGRSIEEDQVDKLLAALSNMTCTGYMNDAKSGELENPTHVITAKGDNSYILSLFGMQNEEEEKVPGTSSMNEYPFFLSGYSVEQIIKQIETLFPELAPEPEEKTAGQEKEQAL